VQIPAYSSKDSPSCKVNALASGAANSLSLRLESTEMKTLEKKLPDFRPNLYAAKALIKAVLRIWSSMVSHDVNQVRLQANGLRILPSLPSSCRSYLLMFRRFQRDD
jgi:hypothetical protein